MASLIFLTSTPPTIEEGSGTWVGISMLRAAIAALGHQVTLVAPQTPSRVAFNLRAPSILRRMTADALIGFDFDGVFVKRPGMLHIAAIKGVLADEAEHESGISRLALSLQARLERMHVRRADRVIATSLYSAERIATFYGVERQTIRVVPELIDLAVWERALSAAPVEPGRPRVLCVAHLYRRKRVDVLLRAFARVGGNAVLRIAGVGPEKSRLERLAGQLGIAGRVDFLGHLPFARLVAEYRNAAAFALPSAQEGFGIVFLEAMASSLPVVAARAAAVPEVVVDGSTGLLTPPGDDEALATGLMSLLEDDAIRRSMGSAGRERVRQFDSPLVGRNFLQAIGVAQTTLSVPDRGNSSA
jgi:glycosyltransferase involved in cell wall biosynthesis